LENLGKELPYEWASTKIPYDGKTGKTEISTFGPSTCVLDGIFASHGFYENIM
jgi:hypothetical protein